MGGVCWGNLVLGGLPTQVRRFAERAWATPRVFLSSIRSCLPARSQILVLLWSAWWPALGLLQTGLFPLDFVKRCKRSEPSPSEEQIPVGEICARVHVLSPELVVPCVPLPCLHGSIRVRSWWAGTHCQWLFDPDWYLRSRSSCLATSWAMRKVVW